MAARATTYAMMWGVQSDNVTGAEWAVVAVALLLDLIAWSTLRDR